MNLNQLIASLEDMREDLGGDTEVFMTDRMGYAQLMDPEFIDVDRWIECRHDCPEGNEQDPVVLLGEQYD